MLFVASWGVHLCFNPRILEFIQKKLISNFKNKPVVDSRLCSLPGFQQKANRVPAEAICWLTCEITTKPTIEVLPASRPD